MHLGLNKGEARNSLARAIFFYRRGAVRDRLREELVTTAAPYVKRLKLAGRLLQAGELQAEWRECLGEALARAEAALVAAGGGVGELRRAEQLTAARRQAAQG